MITDSSGSIITQKSFAHATYDVELGAIAESADGKIFLTGCFGSNCYIVKMDFLGSLEWAKLLNKGDLFNVNSIARATSGNGVILTGSARWNN